MTQPEITAEAAHRFDDMSELTGLEACNLHRKTPYGMTNVSIGQLSIARHYGGITFNGDSYTYLPLTDELIRNDVLKWKRKQKKQSQPNQPTACQNDLAFYPNRTYPPRNSAK